MSYCALVMVALGEMLRSMTKASNSFTGRKTRTLIFVVGFNV